jgi:lipopolysaccharide export system permease protein
MRAEEKSNFGLPRPLTAPGAAARRAARGAFGAAGADGIFPTACETAMSIIPAMRGVTRYILRHVVAVTVFVTVALASAIWLTQSLRLIDLIVNRGLSLSTFLYMAFLTLPSFVSGILPIAVFAACLFTYNRLSTDSELVVMRSTGLSPMQLAKPASLLAGAAVLIGYAMTLYLLPTAQRAFKDLQFTIRHSQPALFLQEGVFNTVTDGVTVYVRERAQNGELRGILVHDGRVTDKPVTMMAENGTLVQTELGPRVVMVNGNRQFMDMDSGKLSLLYFDRYTLDIQPDKEPVGLRWREPGERYLPELFWPGNTPDDIANYERLRGEAHERLTSPLLSLSFTCIGLAALLSGKFSRRGQMPRILFAILAMLIIQASALALHNMVGKMPGAVPLMYVNALLPIAAGLYVLLSPSRPRWLLASLRI